MRQLEETLLILAGQDQPVDPQDLIDKIEQDLRGEDRPVVGMSPTPPKWEAPHATRRSPRRGALAFVAAALAALAIGLPVWILGRTSTPDVATTTQPVTTTTQATTTTSQPAVTTTQPGAVAPTGAFDLGTDSFCEWISPGTMTTILSIAQKRAGTDYDLRGLTVCDDTSGGFWNSTLTSFAGELPPRVAASSLDDADTPVQAAYAETSPGDFIGHPLLDDSVTYHIRTYQFLWQEGVDLLLRVEGHDDEILYFGFGVDDGNRDTYMTPEYEELALAAANELLVRLNWVDPAPEGTFSWGEDLSRWMTPDEMTVALTRAVTESGAGPVPLSGADFGALRGESTEIVIGGWRVLVHNGDHGGAYDGPPSGTDPRLPRGVTYDAEDGFGWGGYIFSGPNSDEMIAIHLLPPGSYFGYPRASQVEAYREAMFSFASAMLLEMGWADR